MKLKDAFILSVIATAIVFTINCAKEDIEPETNKGSKEAIDLTTENRSGGGDIVFFRKSLSTDNFLLANNQVPRKYVAYNNTKVEFVKFDASGKPQANISGVLCSHYNITVKFTDGAVESLTAYSKDTLPSFSLSPTSSLLHHTNSCNKITWELMPADLVIYNEFRNADGKSQVWEISCGEKVVGQKWKETWNKSANLFTIQHSH